MPGMHIRYNEVALKYEYSDTGTDQGPWMTLPLANNVGGALANVAYTNVINNFTSRQFITGKLGDNYAGSALEIQTAAPKLSFHWPGLVASQIGMDNAGVIRTYDNPGTGYENFAAKTITSNGNIMCGGNIHGTAGYLYPGEIVGGGAFQGTWYLSSHSSYGLYTNTGLFVVGQIWERNRGNALGDWIVFAVGQGNFWSNVGTVTFNSGTYVYTYVGSMCFISLNINLTFSNINQALYFHTPIVPIQYMISNDFFLDYATNKATNSQHAKCYSNAGQQSCSCVPLFGGSFNAGNFILQGQLFFQF